jgi:hypothetical protein
MFVFGFFTYTTSVLMALQGLHTYTDGNCMFETVPAEGWRCVLIRRFNGRKEMKDEDTKEMILHWIPTGISTSELYSHTANNHHYLFLYRNTEVPVSYSKPFHHVKNITYQGIIVKWDGKLIICKEIVVAQLMALTQHVWRQTTKTHGDINPIEIKI